MVERRIELGYLGVEVADPGAFGRFLSDVVGLFPGEGHDTWRNDAKSQRILVREGPLNDATVLGFEAVDADAFAAAVSRLEDAGYPPQAVKPELIAARRVADLVVVESPWGVSVELVHGLVDAVQPFASPLVGGGFLTGGLGFGHVVFATAAFDESCRFVTDGLGLAQSDWIETEIAAGIELEVRFYHCNERHHSLALARAPVDLPRRLHHVMFEVNDRDDVGYAFDRAWSSGLTIANGLGRHDNDGMFSFYVVSPAGFQVEVGYGARRITDGWDDNRRYDRISIWGHQPVSASTST